MNSWRISALLLLFLLASCSKQPATKTEEPAKPNIIFILVDDMGWGDLGAFWQNKRQAMNDSTEAWHATPNLDKLAMDGARMPHHYAAAPVCAPSRASLLLGVSQGHANVRDNQFDKVLEDDHTLATVLKEAGYATAIVGKWGLQGLKGHSPKTWDSYPIKRGFDFFLGYVRHIDGHNHYPAHKARKRPPSELYYGTKEISDKLKGVYTTDLFTATAKKWITDRTRKHPKQPFFLYLAYDTPHASLQVPATPYPEGGGLDGGIQWIGKPGHFINTSDSSIDDYIYPAYAAKDWPMNQKRFATMVHRLDRGVGDLVQLLKDLEIYENTLIVFSSDNGPHQESYGYGPHNPTFFESYGPFDGIKRDVWEGGVREPTFAVWPARIPEKHVVDNPSAQYDWLATFADAAGLPIPANSDGVSLLPALTQEKAPERGLVYVEYEQGGRTPMYEDFAANHRGRRRNQMQMIRMGEYVGVRYDVQSAHDDFEIYNIIKDPGEEQNLAQQSNRPAFFDSLQQRMKAMALWSRRPNGSAPRPYDDALLPPVKHVETVPGVHWKAFEGRFPWLPKVHGLTADNHGYTQRPTLKVNSASKQVLYFTGYIRVPKDGTYTFRLSTDTACLLRLHNATVIDTDANYQPGEKVEATIKLKAGLHPFRLYYMADGTTEPMLQWKWSGPGIEMQLIPAEVFYRAKN